MCTLWPEVEGADKPLSNLQNGQIVKIRQNANGVVTYLTIDTEIISKYCSPANLMVISSAHADYPRAGFTKSQLRMVSLITLRLASKASGETMLM